MSPETKIKSLKDASAAAETYRRAGKKIVLCHGVFDLLHIGHIRYLTAARKFGDVLFVTLTADKHVKRGPGRPVFTEQLRAEAVAALQICDVACVADFSTAVEVLQAIKPDFYAKGREYKDASKDVTGMITVEEDTLKAFGGKLVFTDEITFSSSKLINHHLDTYPEATMKYLKDFSSRHTAESIGQMLQRAKELKVLVIGDSIIDQYIACSPMGKSAKENIVAQRYRSLENFAGGVLATANHTAQVAGKLELITTLGQKNSFESFIRPRLAPHIVPHFVYHEDRSTTVKTRYIGDEASRKLFEVCVIDDEPPSEKEEKELLALVERLVPNFNLVIVNDFGHGMITRSVMESICAKAKCLALNVQTNSANIGFNLITKYLRADLVCIDEYEMRLAVRERHGALEKMTKKIADFLDCKQLLVTRGAAGSLLFDDKAALYTSAPALATTAVDKVGAGDAFFSYASPCFALGCSPELTSFIGNAAGALKLQIPGNREPVKYPDLMKFVTRLLNF